MAEYVWKHLPYAIYFDTNVLRSAGPTLDAQWINELLSITNEYRISLCVSDLVLAEWGEHIMEVLEGNRHKLLSSIALLNHYDVQVPDTEPGRINLPEKAQLFETLSRKLKAAGFDVIQNWDAPLSQLLSEAVAKKPPFEQGGKGLCDAVILETYAKHARENLKGTEARVLVVSNDAAVKRSDRRFTERGISVDFVGESDIVGKLKSLLSDEVATYIEHKKSRLKEYVLTHGPAILDFVGKTPLRITDWMLVTKEEDRIFGVVESILSARPTKITDAIGGVPTYGEQTPVDRYPIQIFVEIELDLSVSQYNFAALMQTRAIVQPNLTDKNLPVTLEERASYPPQRITRTIRRSITVLATIDAEKAKQDVLDDFRIESDSLAT
jgi:hypothetical protein